MTTARNPMPARPERGATRLLTGLVCAAALGAASLFAAPAASAADEMSVTDGASLADAVTAASGGATVHAVLTGDVVSDETLVLAAGTLVLDLAGHSLEVTGDEDDVDGGAGVVVESGAQLVIVGPGEADVYGGEGAYGVDGDPGDPGANGAWGSTGAPGDPDGGDGGDGGDGDDGQTGHRGGDGSTGGHGGDGVVNSGIVVVIDAALVVDGGWGGDGGYGGDGGQGGYGGQGGTGGPAYADGAEGGWGGTGGDGGTGGVGGVGGDGGDGGLGLVNLGTLLLLDGASVPGGGTAGAIGGLGGAGEPGEAGDDGDDGTRGWPVDDILLSQSGMGGRGGDGGGAGDGGRGGMAGRGGAGGEGLAPGGTGSVIADQALEELLPASVQTIANAVLHAQNGTGASWWAQAGGLDEIAEAFAAAALGGTTVPSHPGHTLLGWSAEAGGSTLVASDTAFGQQPIELFAVWQADASPAPELARTGSTPAAPLVAGGALVLAGLVALGLRRMRHRGAKAAAGRAQGCRMRTSASGRPSPGTP